MDGYDNCKKKLERVKSMKEASERLVKKSKNNEQVQTCYKSSVLLDRQEIFYENQLKACSNNTDSLEMIQPLGSGCSATIQLNIPFVTYDNFKTRRSENRYDTHAYIEVFCNDEIFQSSLVKIDQNINEIVKFNINLNDVDPNTVIKLYIYAWQQKANDCKKTIMSKKTSTIIVPTKEDSSFDLYAIYDSTIISLARNNLFEYVVINPENILSSFTEYNKIASAVLFIYPEKYSNIFSKNKLVIMTVKEVLNMEEEGDECSFLTLYWNIDKGCLKFYFDVYLSKCLEKLTTPINEIENISINEMENELIISSVTLVITLMIENTSHLHFTAEIIEKTMSFSQCWPSSLISFPRSTTKFLKNAIKNSHLFFDSVGMPIPSRTSNVT